MGMAWGRVWKPFTTSKTTQHRLQESYRSEFQSLPSTQVALRKYHISLSLCLSIYNRDMIQLGGGEWWLINEMVQKKILVNSRHGLYTIMAS